MHFGIILTIDKFGAGEFVSYPGPTPGELSPRKVLTLSKRGVWTKTEGGTCDDWGDGLVSWHAKWCGLLTKPQFKEFVDRYGFEARSMCDTMGAFGMPGVEPWYGCAPAWSIETREDETIVNAYVTPWPTIKKVTGVADREENWERIKDALRSMLVGG